MGCFREIFGTDRYFKKMDRDSLLRQVGTVSANAQKLGFSTVYAWRWRSWVRGITELPVSSHSLERKWVRVTDGVGKVLFARPGRLDFIL